MPKMTPQSGSRWPDKLLLGHLGALLAPSWPQVRPSCHHFGHPAPVQNRPKSAKTASCTFFSPRSPPRAPRPSPSIGFSAFRVNFQAFSIDFFRIFAFRFDLSPWTSKGGSPKRSSWKERGRRYSPQASSIYIYIYIYMSIYVYMQK